MNSVSFVLHGDYPGLGFKKAFAILSIKFELRCYPYIVTPVMCSGDHDWLINIIESAGIDISGS